MPWSVNFKLVLITVLSLLYRHGHSVVVELQTTDDVDNNDDESSIKRDLEVDSGTEPVWKRTSKLTSSLSSSSLVINPLSDVDDADDPRTILLRGSTLTPNRSRRVDSGTNIAVSGRQHESTALTDTASQLVELLNNIKSYQQQRHQLTDQHHVGLQHQYGNNGGGVLPLKSLRIGRRRRRQL